jgi:hypothetical protein
MKKILELIFEELGLAEEEKRNTYFKHQHKLQEIHFEISGSHSSEYEDGCLLGCCAV